VNDQRPEFLFDLRQASKIVTFYRFSKTLYDAPRKKRDHKKKKYYVHGRDGA